MLNEELHFLLLKSFHHSNKEIVQQILSLGMLPGQPKILEYLLEHDGAIAKEISSACVIDKSTITGLINRMEKRGLIYKKNHHLDRRACHIYLTEKGIEFGHQVKKVCLDVDKKALQGISEKEQYQLLQLLNKVISNLNK